MSVTIQTEKLHLSFPTRARIELVLNTLSHQLPSTARIRLLLRIDARESYEGLLSIDSEHLAIKCIDSGPNAVLLVDRLIERVHGKIEFKKLEAV